VKDIDAVTVSTPDHTHAPAAAMAIKMGKHVYVQKPLTHSVYEARRLRELATEHKVCTQMGNQGTALDDFRASVELLRSGLLGEIKEVHVWTNRPVWPQAPKVTKRPPAMEPPKHVKWDLFLGPAPERPYAEYEEMEKGKKRRKGAYHAFNWRGWWDFGTGALGDMACHTANMPFMGLGLGRPVAVTGESEALNDETYPGWAKVTYEFKRPGSDKPLKLTWYEGKKDGKRVLPSLDLLHGRKEFSASGSLIVAERGSLYSPDDYGATRVLLGKDVKDITLPRAPKGRDTDLSMKAEWVEAIRKKNPKLARGNFDYSALLTEVVLLGNCAIRAGKRLEYDGEKMTFTNDSSADKFLKREYRTGWKL
jgi:predicted dehydrogenase